MKTLTVISKKHGTHTILYDDEDEVLVSQYEWKVHRRPQTNTLYAQCYYKVEEADTTLMFHRLVMGIYEKNTLVDHKDHNGLNNQKENLRCCSNKENIRNQGIREKGSSKFKGVYYHKRLHKKPWEASIRVDKKLIHLGKFETEEEAALAYNKAALQYFGDFAFLNTLPESLRNT